MADDTQQTDTTDIWASPNQNTPHAIRPKTPKTPQTPKTPTGEPQSEPVDHEAALRRELEGVRGINESIEGVISTLKNAGGNMEIVLKSVNNASTLLNTWTRILSQTEHNQRLILHPGWKGATEDLADQEAEALARQHAAERRAAEEEERREELKRKREEEEGRRQASTTAGGRGVRRTRSTRARGSTSAARGGGTSMSTRSASSASGNPGGRGGSGIGRGAGSTRGRTRPPR